MRIAGLIVTLLLSAGSATGPPSFKVIVREDCEASDISREDLSDMFLKVKTLWPLGGAVHPVEPADSSEREDFARVVHQKSLGAIRAYWLQQVFSGRDVPPLERRTDAEVEEYVRTTPGGIGYVSDKTLISGVKVLQLRRPPGGGE